MQKPSLLERLFESLSQNLEALVHVAPFFVMGAMIGLAQLRLAMKSFGAIPWSLGVARAMASGGLAMSASAVLLWFPEADRATQLGVAAAVASLGTTFLENILVRVIGNMKGGS